MHAHLTHTHAHSTVSFGTTCETDASIVLILVDSVREKSLCSWHRLASALTEHAASRDTYLEEDEEDGDRRAHLKRERYFFHYFSLTACRWFRETAGTFATRTHRPSGWNVRTSD